jgi:DNA (cytosine-5)-methyltransferase 1
VAGLRTICHVERDAYAAAVLVARMAEAALDPAPIWDDVATFDGRPWRGLVDLIVGGFPCQDVSNAGARRGFSGERSGPGWANFARLIGEILPRWVFVENVSALRARGLRRVLADLRRLGYSGAWCILPASAVGAPHHRARLFLLAYRDDVADASSSHRGVYDVPPGAESREDSRPRAFGRGMQEDLADGRADLPEWPPGPDEAERWAEVLAVRPDVAPAAQSPLYGVADGLAPGLGVCLCSLADQGRVCGNGVVPAQAEHALGVLWAALFE